MEAISKQGKRNDLIDEINRLSNPHKINENSTSCQVGTKSERSNESVGKEYGLSARNVARYMRITELITPLQIRIDNGEIPFIPSISLSYLSSFEQGIIEQLLSETSHKVDMKKAEFLRLYSERKKLTKEKILQILSGEFGTKSKPKNAPPLKIKAKIYQKHFIGSYTQSEMESIIDKALTDYFANNIRIVKSDYV